MTGGSSYMDLAQAASTPAVLDRPDLACRQPGIDPEIFYPGRGGSPEAARLVCAECPAVDACREWALATGQRFGVWGGTTDEDRKDIMAARGAPKRVEYRQKLTAVKAERIRALYAAGVALADIAFEYGVSKSNVSAIVAGRTWRTA